MTIIPFPSPFASVFTSKRIMDSEAAAYERAVRLIRNLELTETEAA